MHVGVRGKTSCVYDGDVDVEFGIMFPMCLLIGTHILSAQKKKRRQPSMRQLDGKIFLI